jgi:hypothetical protein
VAAAFTHRTSRAGDPQLHTHVLVANVAKGEDGVWSAPDARRLYGHSRTAGFLYQGALRWTWTSDGDDGGCPFGTPPFDNLEIRDPLRIRLTRARCRHAEDSVRVRRTDLDGDVVGNVGQ